MVLGNIQSEYFILIAIILLEEYLFAIYGNDMLKFKFKSQVDLKKIIAQVEYECGKIGDGPQATEVRVTPLMPQRPTSSLVTQR